MLNRGCYNINPITWIFGERHPNRIMINGTMNKLYQVDVQSDISFDHEDSKNGFRFGNISTNIVIKKERLYLDHHHINVPD